MDWPLIILTTEDRVVGPDRYTVELERRLKRVAEIVGVFGGESASRQIAAVVIEQWEREGRP